jgi:hypothetical protein
LKLFNSTYQDCNSPFSCQAQTTSSNGQKKKQKKGKERTGQEKEKTRKRMGTGTDFILRFQFFRFGITVAAQSHQTAGARQIFTVTALRRLVVRQVHIEVLADTVFQVLTAVEERRN